MPPAQQQLPPSNTDTRSRMETILDGIVTSAKNLTYNPNLHYERDPQSSPLRNRMSWLVDTITKPFSNEITYEAEIGKNGLDINALRNALIAQESGGDYKAISKVTDRKGQHSYGKYQILESNIPVWTEKVLGRKMTAQEFLQDSSAQDRVFNRHLQDLVEKYGNIEDVASAYFSGGPYHKNKANKDKSGKSVSSYVEDIRKKYYASLQNNHQAQVASAADAL